MTSRTMPTARPRATSKTVFIFFMGRFLSPPSGVERGGSSFPLLSWSEGWTPSKKSRDLCGRVAASRLGLFVRSPHLSADPTGPYTQKIKCREEASLPPDGLPFRAGLRRRVICRPTPLGIQLRDFLVPGCSSPGPGPQGRRVARLVLSQLRRVSPRLAGNAPLLPRPEARGCGNWP